MSNGDDDADRSFEARLRAARDRRGLDPEPKPAAAGQPVSAMGVGMRVGVELVSALAVGLAIGWALDRWLHTRPLMLVVFVLLGGAAGIANVWRLMGPGGPGAPGKPGG